LPLFGFDPDSESEPNEINFAQRGLWAQDAKGASLLRLHLQAVHNGAANLVRMDISSEPVLAQHPRKFPSWREALIDVHVESDSALHAAACVGGTHEEECAPQRRSLLSNVHAFVFKCWPRLCDGRFSVVDLER
jgi:hypothetical protein